MNERLIFGAALTSMLLVAGCDDDASNNVAGGTGGNAAGSGAGGETSNGGAGGGSGGETSVGGSGGGGGAPAESGHVFSMTNAVEINELVIYERDADGSLTELEPLPTGGLGSGNGLGSQGAVTLSPGGDYLYLVNAGSNQISSFRIYDDHLALVDLVSSGGVRPVSVTASDDRVYVVNAGDTGGVQGFVTQDGVLTSIAASAQPLSDTTGTGPAQISLTPAGDALILTEKATNNLLTYWVAPDGSLSQPTVTASVGTTPFGFDFAPGGFLLVSEAFGGNPGESAVSSYALGGVEPLVISSSVLTEQTAACWLLVAKGTFAYTTNTASNTISGYNVAGDGSLTRFDDGGVTADLGASNSPIDMALAGDDDEFLYVINAASDLVVGFSVADDGTLVRLDGDHPIAGTAVGLAAR